MDDTEGRATPRDASVFTVKEIVLEIRNDVKDFAAYAASSQAQLTAQEGIIADHEKRTRSLEHFRYAVPSAALIAAAVAAASLALHFV